MIEKIEKFVQIIAFFIFLLLFGNGYNILAILFVIVSIGIYYIYNKEKKEKNRIELKNEIQYYMDIFTEHLNGFYIIDSNIWMNPVYEKFFELLEEILIVNNRKLLILGTQFDEICNIKIRTNYGNKKNINSRLAINRIEKFQSKNLLNIYKITKNSDNKAYADIDIIDIIMEVSKKGYLPTLISDDKELRVRARQIALDNNIVINIVDGIELNKVAVKIALLLAKIEDDKEPLIINV